MIFSNEQVLTGKRSRARHRRLDGNEGTDGTGCYYLRWQLHRTFPVAIPSRLTVLTNQIANCYLCRTSFGHCRLDVSPSHLSMNLTLNRAHVALVMTLPCSLLTSR